MIIRWDIETSDAIIAQIRRQVWYIVGKVYKVEPFPEDERLYVEVQ